MIAEIVFNAWAKRLKDKGISRFLKSERQELIEDLVDLFYKNKIDIETAQLYKNKVKELLVTLEGKKGKGKYKGWNENVVIDYDAVLSEYYLEQENKTKEKPSDINILPENELINEWGQKRFGELFNQEISLMCHTIGHIYNRDFQNEVLSE